MSKQYYLSTNGTQIGPFTREAVLTKIEAQDFQLTDYVFDDEVGDWMLMLEHPDFAAHVSFQRTGAKPAEAKETLKENAWFILKDGVNQGPFSQLDIIRMLQEKSLFEYDFIFNSKLNEWRCVAELEEFCPENIRKVKETEDTEIAEIFFRRRHARASYGASLIVHNNMKVFRGQSIEISAGGAGILINTSDLNPGQSLFLHFQPGTGVPPFNAVCEIVSKQFVKDEVGEEVPVKYGVRFTTVSQSVRDSIRTFTSSQVAQPRVA